MVVIVRLAQRVSPKEIKRMIGTVSTSLCRKTCALAAVLLSSVFLARIGTAEIEPDGGQAVNTEIAILKDKIRTLVSELEKDFPQSNEPKVLRGMMFRQFGDHARAVEIWEKVLQDSPQRVDVLNHLGKAALEMEEYEKAVFYWRRALAINPKLSGLHHDTGFALLEAGQYRRAIKEFQDELKLSPKSGVTLNLLGQCHLQLKDYQKAKEAYLKAIEIDANDASAYYGLGTVCMRLKQGGKAKEYMARFKALRPSAGGLDRGGYSEKYDLAQMRRAGSSLILGAGVIYRNGGDVERADLLLEWAVKLDRENTLGYMKRQAIAYQMAGRHSQGLVLIEKVAELEPDNADNHLAVGMFSLGAGKDAKAEAAFRRTIAQAPQLADGYRELARMYNMRGAKPQEALKLAGKAVELEGTAEDYYVLGRAHMNNNQMPEALSAMRKALDRDPNNTLYRQAYDFLRRQGPR